MDKTATRIEDLASQPLAIQGGPQANPDNDTHDDLFHWPIVTDEDIDAVTTVMRAGSFSGLDVTKAFEAEWGQYLGTAYNLSYPNGTLALQVAMYVAGVRRGDEVICPSITYWASILQCFTLGATAVFTDVDRDTLCIDPADIEHRITDKTRAIMVVHYCGYPCDMDSIMAIADKHGLIVIEDVSHAHGALYNGRMVGSIGHISAMSMMGIKSFAIGEGGMLCTHDKSMYEHAIAYAHYVRHGEMENPQLKAIAGLPLGGIKGRLNQTCAAMGRVQLRHYPKRIRAIQSAMNRFWDLLEGTPGLKPHRPATDSDCTMGGWYNPIGRYVPEQLGGLPVGTFIEAVHAEGGRSGRGVNFPLHLHPVMNDVDVYGDGKPTRLAFASRDVRQSKGSLPVAEAAGDRAFGIPYFKHDRPDIIERYAAAFRKVALQASNLVC
jgi:perosamine synthetase